MCSQHLKATTTMTSSSPSTDDSATSWTSTAALCLGMLTHSYLLISVFPYSGYLAMDLLGLSQEEAAPYAGLVAATFMVGRASTSYLWGRWADTYGRVTVLTMSLGISGILSIGFGLSSSFGMALAFRFLLGCANGIMGTIKTIISERAVSESHETQSMTLVIGMWAWGFLMSPAISGALAEPLQQYPHLQIIQSEDTWIHQCLTRFPFVLPNLLACLICLVSVLLIRTNIEETLPNPRSVWHLGPDLANQLRCCCVCRSSDSHSEVSYESVNVDRSQTDIEFNEEVGGDGGPCDVSEHAASSTMSSLWAHPPTRMCLSIYWLFSLVGLTIDEAFPLFLMSEKAGFGLPELSIGKVLSACGLLFAIFQYHVYGVVYKRFGLYGAIRVGALLSAPTMLLVPLSLPINAATAGDDFSSGSLTWPTFVFLSLVFAWFRVFALCFFSSISVAVNRTVPAGDRATMNGLSVLGGSVAKALGPAVAGILVRTSVVVLHRHASIMIFGFIAGLGCLVSWSSSRYLTENDSPATSTTFDENRLPKQQETVELVKTSITATEPEER